MCESHDVYFLYYFSLLFMYSLLFSFQLSYEAAAAAVGFSRNLGCLRTLMDLFSTCSFINVIILLHLLLFYFSFFFLNPLPGLNALTVD